MDRQHHHNSHNEEEANTSPRTATIEILDGPHQDAIRLAIIDGLPLTHVVRDVYSDLLMDDRPICAHTELCAGFDTGTLRFDAMVTKPTLIFSLLPCGPSFGANRWQLLDIFQRASPGSIDFKTRLIQILARSIHQVAVILYNNNPDLSALTSTPIKDVHTWEPPKGASDSDGRWEVWWMFNPDGPPATLFGHKWYTNVENYPEGAADMASYWAESRILGGVVLFDRAAEARGESDAVYLHPDRGDVTYRICLMTDVQKKAMMDFIQAKEAGSEAACPLPVLPDGTNTQRVDPEEPIRVTGVYRDIWERLTPSPEWMGDGRAHCVRNPLDFPSKNNHHEASYRWSTRTDRW